MEMENAKIIFVNVSPTIRVPIVITNRVRKIAWIEDSVLMDSVNVMIMAMGDTIQVQHVKVLDVWMIAMEEEVVTMEAVRVIQVGLEILARFDLVLKSVLMENVKMENVFALQNGLA